LGGDTDELESILPDAFRADPALTRRQVRLLLRRALRNTRKSGELTPSRLLAEARSLAEEILGQPSLPYTMWTKFRATGMAFHSSFRVVWDEVTLESANDLPGYMVQEDYFLNGHGDISPRQPLFYGHIIARGAARDHEMAAERLMGALDIFMAVFNLTGSLNHRSIGSHLRADGQLWGGPYHFLFQGRRFLGNEQLWFDPEFDEEAWNLSAPRMGAVLQRIPHVRTLLRALATHPMREVLLRVLRLMQEGMRSRDESYTVLRYWSALEQLYGDLDGRTKNYPRIIQRATFANTDKVLARWKLKHIADFRNEYVHAGREDEDLRTMSQHLLRLLARHVHYLLLHTPDVLSHERWLAIVDLPDDEALLEQRREIIAQRIAMMRRSQQ
jgi:hypothetical protein